MDTQFERNKNLKASAYTAAITALLFFVMFFVSWQVPVVQPPVVDEGIEVNLGNSDEGLGDVAPEVPGAPADAQDELADNPPPPSSVSSEPSNEAPNEPSDNVNTVAVNASTKKEDNKPVSESKKNTAKTAEQPTTTVEVKPKPKAVYGAPGNTGTGGNNADSYNGVSNQGIAGGQGDQGKLNGNPNSDSYTGSGGTGNSGVSIRQGLTGRKFTKLPSFEDDFNTPAKVAVDIRVNEAGSVVSAIINPRGTTTVNANIRSIAIRKAKELKFTAADEEQSGTIVFDFKIRG